MAEQYGLSWDYGAPLDCTTVTGNPADFNLTKCNTVPDPELDSINVVNGTLPCIFPYIYDDKRYDGCLQFAASGFIIPSYYCPVFNSNETRIDEKTNKKINVYRKATETSSRPTDASCFDQVNNVLVPQQKSCALEVQPFAQCQDNCKGGKPKTLFF